MRRTLVDDSAKRLDCPVRGAAYQPIRDLLTRTWRHLNFFQYQAVLAGPRATGRLHGGREDLAGQRAVDTEPLSGVG